MKKILSLVLAFAMIFSLAACASEAPAATVAPVATETPVATEAPAPVPAADPELLINAMVLNGTTGFGMANLIHAAQNGEAKLNYSFSVETDASNITAALINGTVDIAALPTNAASTVYNKTQGQVQVLALNTLGVLYLLSDGSEEIKSFADLKGKTVYAPAQNPTFVFQYLCEANGLKVGEDIIIDNSYAQPANLNSAVSAGEVALAVLPEPMVTVARSSNDKLQVVMDLTEEWDKVSTPGSLVQGCVVVRTEFAKAHPEELKVFLEEYEASINALMADIPGSAEKIQSTGVFAKAPVAAKAIPNCNLCFIAGEEMKGALGSFLETMFNVAPASVGGAVPADDFYCVVK